MADIHISHLVKVYPGTTEPATDDVSLDIHDGEFMVLLGPSGCGKTTLLRMVAGLELPDSGSVAIGGRDITYLPPQSRNLSMVFQSYAVFPHRRVRDNIAFGLVMNKTPRAQIQEKVARAAEILRLEPYLDRYPAQLSGGQRQRVAVARAIVMDSDVLLMDEPLSNLDALLRLDFRAELKKIVQDIGTTTVYVTHDQVEALSLSDRVAVMRKGEIVQLGDPIDVYDDPVDTFVGGFLGSPPMNFLDAEATADGTLRIGGQQITGPEHLRSAEGRGPTQGQVSLGVRAENIEVLRDERPAEALRATVQVVEPLGAATLLTVDVDGQVLKAQTPPTVRSEPHQEVWLRVAPEAMRIYDKETGLALLSDLRPRDTGGPRVPANAVADGSPERAAPQADVPADAPS
jgi:multiple sugar transport system ATP-binding protein